MTNTNSKSDSQADSNTETSTALTNVLALPADGTITATGLQLPESMSVEQWRDVAVTIGQIGGAIQWWIGDWWLFGVEHQWDWGEGREAVEAAGFNYQTVKQYGSVAAAYKWCDRSHHLKFTHHLAAMAAPAKERKRWLSRAAKKGWSVSQLRAEIAEAERITESSDTADDDGSAGAPSEEDQQEPGNGTDPTASAEHRKSEYAAADDESETATEGGAKPDEAAAAIVTEDESVTTPAAPAATTEKNLLATWDESSEEDREILRDLVLDEFSARSTGTDLYNFIPPSRFEEVIGEFLDRLGVDRMLEKMSAGFGKALRARLPAPKGEASKKSKTGQTARTAQSQGVQP